VTRAVAHWSGVKTRFDVESESGHRAVVDEPPLLGENAGMRPTEMLLGALGGCTGVNAVLLLKKNRQRFSSLKVDVQGEQAEQWPRAFVSIHIDFQIQWEAGFEPDRELVAQALDKACNTYCPVDATLSQGTRIEHSQSDL